MRGPSTSPIARERRRARVQPAWRAAGRAGRRRVEGVERAAQPDRAPRRRGQPRRAGRAAGRPAQRRERPGQRRLRLRPHDPAAEAGDVAVVGRAGDGDDRVAALAGAERERGDQDEGAPDGSHGPDLPGARAPRTAYQRSRCTTSSIGRRAAGLKSVPMVWAIGISATWVTWSYGMPSASAASRSCHRCSVVHILPAPSRRSGSDHAEAAPELVVGRYPLPYALSAMSGYPSTSTFPFAQPGWTLRTRFVQSARIYTR